MNRFFRLHAAAVVRNGRGVLLVGPSGSGKSTLTVRLVMEGFGLLSDDEIWIDPVSKLVHPGPRSRVLLRESARDLFPAYRSKLIACDHKGRSWWLEPDEIRPGCRALPASIWGVICLGALGARGAPDLIPIGQFEAFGHVLNEAMNFPDVRAVGVPLLSDIVHSARLFRLLNGNLDECARILIDALP